MAVEIVTSFDQQCDANGDPMSGALVYVYDVNSTTPRTIYSDTALGTTADNPIECDAAGRHDMRYTAAGSYKIVVKTSAGVSVYTRDNIDGRVPVGAGALPVASGGTGATSAGAARTNLSVPAQSEMDTANTNISNLNTWTGYTLTTRTRIASGTTAQQPAAGTIGFRYDTTTSRLVFDNGSAWRNVLTAGDSTAADALSGSVIQYAEATPYTSNTDITTVMPYDDTIPQIGEGVEVLTVTFTPKRSDSKIVVEADLIVGFDASAATASAAIFKNSGVNAVAANGCDSPEADKPSPISIKYSETLSVATAITYTVRVGPNANTIRLNGTSTARRYGGVSSCTLRVWEIRA